MQTTYQGKISKKEYSKALEMHFSQLKWTKWLFGLFLVILVFSLVVTITRQPSIAKTLFPGILFPLVIFTSPWWMIALQASSYNQKGNIYHAPVSGFIDDHEITVNGENSKSSISWSAYTHYKKADSMILLYQGKNCFNIFTKGMFQNEVAWNQFVEMLHTRFPKASK